MPSYFYDSMECNLVVAANFWYDVELAPLYGYYQLMEALPGCGQNKSKD